MKLQFLLSLLPRDRSVGVRDAYCATARARIHAAANDDVCARRKPRLLWKRNTTNDTLEARWTTQT